jgi:hypothetical protein
MPGRLEAVVAYVHTALSRTIKATVSQKKCPAEAGLSTKFGDR